MAREGVFLPPKSIDSLVINRYTSHYLLKILRTQNNDNTCCLHTLTASFLHEEHDERAGQKGGPKSEVEPDVEAQVLAAVLLQLKHSTKNHVKLKKTLHRTRALTID